MVISQGRDTEISKWSKPIDMTIQWKAFKEQFLIIPLVSQLVKYTFSEIFEKYTQL
jgi:hypothetical protein